MLSSHVPFYKRAEPVEGVLPYVCGGCAALFRTIVAVMLFIGLTTGLPVIFFCDTMPLPLPPRPLGEGGKGEELREGNGTREENQQGKGCGSSHRAIGGGLDGRGGTRTWDGRQQGG